MSVVAVGVLRDTEFWKITDPDLLGLARELELLARLVFTAQVHLAGEIDTRGTAATHGAPSTAALLRTTVAVSHSEARTMLATSRRRTTPGPAHRQGARQEAHVVSLKPMLIGMHDGRPRRQPMPLMEAAGWTARLR